MLLRRCFEASKRSGGLVQLDLLFILPTHYITNSSLIFKIAYA